MLVSDILIEVRNLAMQKVGSIDPGKVEFIFASAFNGVGSWQIRLPHEHPMCSYLAQPGSGVVVTSSTGQTLFSGYMVQPEAAATVDDLGGYIMFSGVSDEVILQDMLAWPNPASSNPNQSTYAYDTRTNVTENLLRNYVNDNVGPNSPAARMNPRLRVADSGGRGSTQTVKARYDNLLEFLQGVAKVDGFGFKILYDSGGLLYSTYLPTDRSSTIMLTLDNGTLASANTTLQGPTITTAVVGGSGDGAARKFRSYDALGFGNPQTDGVWGRRIEKFINSGGDTEDELSTVGYEALADGGKSLATVKLTPAENSISAYGKDWFLGDVVLVDVNGVRLAQRVTAVIFAGDDENGFRVGMGMGDQVPASFYQGVQLAGTTSTASAGGAAALSPRTAAAPMDLEARLTTLEVGRVDDTGWITGTLGTGWSNYGAGFSTLAYRRKNGIVYVKGLLAGGTTANPLTTLPPGFRPLETKIFSSNAGNVFCRLDVANTGTIMWNVGGTSGFISLDVISFPADL